MTRAWLAASVLLAAGCGPGQGAVRISISYAGPRTACLVVRSSAESAPTQVEERRLENLKHLATKTIGVVPAQGAGDALTVVVEVHERGCDGPLVWTQTRSATATRAVSLLELGVLVRDEDDDTYADARGAFAGGQLAGTDCDDTRDAIHPGAPELCNGLDDDCNDVRDDGQQANTYFPDLDGDGWGVDVGDAGQRACLPPPGYAVDAGDCDDFRAFVHPGGIDSCNGFDDDCSGGVDEGYDVGNACTTGTTCTGVIQCTDAGATFCTAPFAREWFPDEDGDGHGRADGGALLACVPPAGRIANADDCDDGNRFIHTGAREVCDGKDDDCDPSTPDVCADAGALQGFKKFPLPTNGVAWRAIAPFARGFTWVVGENNQIVLRVHEPGFGTAPVDAGKADGGDGGSADAGPEAPYDAGVGDGGFFNYAGRCTGNFRAAWAGPSGRLYLGEGSNIDRLELDGGCVESWFTVTPASEISGLSGVVGADGGITVFAAVHDRRLIRIADLGGDAGSASDRTWTFDAGTRLYTVSALGRDLAVVAGDLNNGQQPFFAQIDADGGVTPRVLPAFAASNPVVFASGMVSAQRSYFGGANLMAYEAVSRAPALVSGPTAGGAFVGLAAFGDRHVLILDGNGRVWRWYGTPQADGGTGPAELFVDLVPATGGALMRAMKATAPDDVWVAGDSNNILHFGD